MKNHQIKNHIWVFVSSLIENPSFDSQTKENMTLAKAKHGSKPLLSDAFMKKIEKSGIIDAITSFMKFKENQAKSKLKELSQHKKILKKEVIDLRKKIDEVGSERDAALHITDSHKVHAETEKEKNAMLEKYIERMENQVVVQQNMMEMIKFSIDALYKNYYAILA